MMQSAEEFQQWLHELTPADFGDVLLERIRARDKAVALECLVIAMSEQRLQKALEDFAEWLGRGEGDVG